jgi:pimeloyl-ACP methyl ester carboxylesterase
MRRARVLGVLPKAFGVVVVALALVASGCGDESEDAATTDTTVVAAPQDFSGRGPFAVGVSRLQLGTGAPVEVFYPVDRGAVPADATAYTYTPEEVWGSLVSLFPPGVVSATEVPDAWVEAPASTSGPFPLVIFSHGWGSERLFYSFHNAHLASWGFLVAAPEHLSRDLLTRLNDDQTTLPPDDVSVIADTVDLLEAENTRTDGALEGRVDTDQVAVEGHSSGGRDAALAADLPEVDTFIALAGVPPVPDDAAAPSVTFAVREDFDLVDYLATVTPADKPSMLIVAENDIGVPPSFGPPVYDWLAPPKRYIELADTGHFFTYDSCAVIQEQGGLQATADALGLDRSSPEIQAAENGCLPEDAPAADVAAVWNHLAVAQLDWVFGIDPDVAAASLQADYLDATFPGRINEYLVDQ